MCYEILTARFYILTFIAYIIIVTLPAKIAAKLLEFIYVRSSFMNTVFIFYLALLPFHNYCASVSIHCKARCGSSPGNERASNVTPVGWEGAYRFLCKFY